MGLIFNPNQPQMGDILRRLRALENASPMNNAAIGRGGIEVYDGGVINISNGGLNVVGSGRFTGTLYADGTVAFSGTFTQSGPSTFTGTTNLNGPTNINGATDINGDTDINGNLDVDGTLDINGAATLNNDLTVQGGGKIKAGVTQINPDGTITLGPGLSLTPDNGTGTAAIQAGASQIQLTPSDPVYWAQFTGGLLPGPHPRHGTQALIPA